MPSTTDVVIVGGGVPGLVLAARTARRSPQTTVLVVERAARSAPIGRGVLVHPITQQMLDLVGMPVPGGPHDGRVERLEEYRDGRRLGSYDVVRLDAGGVEYTPRNVGLDPMRDAARDAVEALPNCALRHEAVVDDITRTAGVWRLGLKGAEGSEEVRARVVVGAEGQRSAVRDASGITTTTVPFPGQVDVMALDERREGPPAITMSVGGREATTVVDNGDGPRTLLFDMRPGGGEVDLEDRGLRPPVRERAAAAGLALGAGAAPRFVVTLQSATVRCSAWYDDGLLLLGDAAHAMHNLGGQGFNLGVQNAVALAGPLATLLQAGDEGPLRAFERYRLPYVTGLQRRQDEFFAQLGAGTLEGSSWFSELHDSLAFGQPGLWAHIDGEG